MSLGSCVELTGGCVSVCTKSVLVCTGVLVAVVTVTGGMGGAVDSVFVGATTGFFLVRQAGESTAAMMATPNANDLTAFFIVPPSGCDDIKSFGRQPYGASRLPFAAGYGERRTAHGAFFDQSGSLF